MHRSPEPHFREEQQLRQWWLWLLLGALAGIVWLAFIQQVLLGRPFGGRPGPDWLVWLGWGLVGVVAPVMLWGMCLVIEVDASALHYRYRPFIGRRSVALAEIKSCRAITYRPVLHYGGWGIRWSPSRGWAYNASGNEGVLIELQSGKQFLLGSHKAEELSRAVSLGAA